jgi:hypothetical protein
VGSELVTGLIGIAGTTCGAGVSYILGDRALRGASRRDSFNRAVAAVAALRGASVLPAETYNSALSDEENAKLTKDLLLLGAQRHHVMTLEARDALAALVPYWSNAGRYRQPWNMDDDALEALLLKILSVRDRRARRRRAERR